MKRDKFFVFLMGFFIIFICVFVVFIDSIFKIEATPLDSVLDLVKETNTSYMGGGAVEGAEPAEGVATILEFSDFECPYCKNVQPALRKLKNKYGDKIRIIYKHFPVHSVIKAEAAECARDQGKFWEMHDYLFEEQNSFVTEDAAAKLKLDKKKFEDCMSSGAKKDIIKKHMAEGKKLGVAGTPTFFIGGKMIPGAIPYSTFVELIDEELGKMNSNNINNEDDNNDKQE